MVQISAHHVLLIYKLRCAAEHWKTLVRAAVLLFFYIVYGRSHVRSAIRSLPRLNPAQLPGFPGGNDTTGG